MPVTVAVGRAAAEAMTAAGQPVPAAIPVTTLVDTGSKGSAINCGIAQQLGIQSCGVVAIYSGTDAYVEVPAYAVRLVLTSALDLETKVIELNLDHIPGADAVIGRDFLSYGVLIYSSRSREFTLAL